MLSLRNRFGIPGVISVIALVFAMLGGAYAASNSSGGGKATASAKAKRGPKGPKGATGPAGPAGPAGPQGPAGAKGDSGAAGSNGNDGAKGVTGANGQSVTTSPILPFGECGEQEGVKLTSASGANHVCNGAKGAQGAAGSPWTAGGTLPSGSTETGAWVIGDGNVAPETNVSTAISFPIPLAAPLSEAKVQSNKLGFPTGASAEEKEHCPGSVSAPKAKSGFLCVYTGVLKHFFVFPAPLAIKPSEEEVLGADVSGTTLLLLSESSELFGTGTWAVTG